MTTVIGINDLVKVLDVLERARTFHKRRDEMNAEVHMAAEVRYSPLTSELSAACDRLYGFIPVPTETR
jgi:putative hemolysin